MFKPKTEKIAGLVKQYNEKIRQLEELLSGKVDIYIDYANVRPWSNKLNWNIDTKRLKQFLDSFDNVQSIKFYNGTLDGDEISEKFSKDAKKVFGDNYKTKPVKIMKQSIDYSSIKPTSTDLLEKFIRKCLLREYKLETVEYLNEEFMKMNKDGKYYIEDRKCNFDVEIGTDMILDFERSNTDTFVLWSGDSDFCDPIEKLLDSGRKVILCATARKVSRELNDLQNKGLIIFDIKKIREFICWKKQIKKAKRTPYEAPKP